ncbi:MAG: MotA/TolQ/ExbB proton channel family protein [bacterium]
MAAGGLLAPFISAGPFALTIIIILFLLSVVTWAIFFRKSRQFRRAQVQTRGFLEAFGYRRNIKDYQELARLFPLSPLVPLLGAAVEEWLSLQNEFSNRGNESLTQLMPNITEAMERAGSRVSEQLEGSLSFLAITTMVAPFLGLLGTVQGVLRTFLSLRGAQLPTLQLIAPGISDALVTTVMGLIVAIPAALFYNYFVGRVRNLQGEMERFTLELTGLFRREACRLLTGGEK